MRAMRRCAPLLLALAFALSGCGNMILERSYHSLEPHSATYWVEDDEDTLRAESYQELVNALLLLVGEHATDGVVRIYGEEPDAGAVAGDACVEVQQDTALGAYLLDYITYDGTAESGYYELSVHFGYRRTAEEQSAIVNATSTEALPDLLRAAMDEGRGAVAIRVGYFATDREGVRDMVRAVYEEFYPPEEPPEAVAEPAPADAPEDGEAPSEEADGTGSGEPDEPELAWRIFFYPDDDHPGIVEVVLNDV